jgi:enamine deaminase RidA (YjgF/YER057c/UK114 family)
MGIAESKLQEMGIEIDQVDRRGCGVLKFRRYRDLLFLSGHGPFDKDGKPLITGRVGVDKTPEDAYEAGRLAAISMLATLKDAIGDLDRIDYFVKALGLVNSGGEFYGMPAVVNGFSDVMTRAFGHRGQHARAAMGCGNHQDNVPMVVDMIVKLKA